MNTQSAVQLVVGLVALMAWTPMVGAQSGGLYRWSDQSGGVHYTQGLDTVPEPFRGQAVRVGGSDPAPSPAAVPTRGAAARRSNKSEPTAADAKELERMMEGMAEAMAKGLEAAFSDMAKDMESAMKEGQARPRPTPAPKRPAEVRPR